MKQNYLSFTAGIIGGLFLYSGIVTFQNSTSSSTAPTISSFENVQLQESLVDPKTNLKQSTPACTQAQLRCNDYQQDISSLLFISEELFDASKKIETHLQNNSLTDSLQREDLMLGVYNVLKQKHADVLTSDYKTSFEERLMWFEDSY